MWEVIMKSLIFIIKQQRNDGLRWLNDTRL